MIIMNVSKHSLIFGLSYALDIAGKNNLSHSKSTAYLSVMISRETGLAEDTVTDIYYAALLHDIAISDEFATNEYKADMKRHCVIGEEIIKKLPLSKEISNYVLYHHEHYNASGPFKLSGENIPKGALIICLASAFDDKFGKSDIYDRNLFLDICSWLDKVKGLFSTEIINAFYSLIKREFFLLDYFNHETKYALSDKIVVSDDVYYQIDDIEKFALCFADIIDQRSPFTFHHSIEIAKLAKKAAAHLGYDDETQNKMYIAGLLHDIGKLHVSIDILHKNGPLTPDERFEINKHTYFTRKILEQIEGFEEIVGFASNHHERLDGTGYPYQMAGDRLCELDRVMAICDVYQALTEERPYREKLKPEQVWSIIDNMAENKHLDKLLIEKIRNVFD
ncbi:MAG: HD domain-containing protein [Holophagales bacterium]|jgi:putative nucleotidyltransferase with HDIG domain|nr:HD domain-containing protein [Holophagales bacterium]